MSNDLYVDETTDQLVDLDSMETGAEEFATTSTKRTLDEGLYVMKVTLLPNVHPKDVKAKPEGTAKEQFDYKIKKSNYVLVHDDGKPKLVVGKKDLKIEVFYNIKEDKTVGVEFYQRVYLVAARNTDKHSIGDKIAGNVENYARIVQALYAASLNIDEKKLAAMIAKNDVTEDDLREVAEEGVTVTGTIKDLTEEYKLDDGTTRTIDKNELSSYGIQAVSSELIENINAL